MLLGDEVAFRMHWPLKAELRVNGDYCIDVNYSTRTVKEFYMVLNPLVYVIGDSVRVTNRPGQQKLGLNGRDDGPVVRFGYFFQFW